LQYEELRKIIKGKKKGLADFSQALKNLRYPVGEFPMIVSITNYDIADKQVILLKTNLLYTDEISENVEMTKYQISGYHTC
jgi:hypothetical protein